MKEVRLRKNDIEVLTAVKAFIDSLPEQIPTIVQLSRRFGINTDKLKKGFKKLFGMAIHKYHLQVKMEAAKRFLTGTELNIDEIAAELGYNDASNFSTSFRKITGMRPRDWRRKNAQSEIT